MITNIETKILKTNYLIGRTIVTTNDDPKIGVIFRLSNDRRSGNCVITFIDFDGNVHETTTNDAELYI